MHAITIQKTLSHRDGHAIVLANDAQQRAFIGTPSGGGAGDYRFVQIDRVTMLELERGTVDLRTVVSERCAGVVFEADADAMRG